MNREEIRNMILGDIKSYLPDGYCIEADVFLSRENEPHHFDMHWDRYLTCLFNYKGHLLYSSNGCYVCDLEDVTSLDILASVQNEILSKQPVPISDESKKELDNDYMNWGRKEWENSEHRFQYWTWDGGKKYGPLKIRRKMTLAEARRYVRNAYKNTSCRSFDLQEVDGVNKTFYNFTVNGED